MEFLELIASIIIIIGDLGIGDWPIPNPQSPINVIMLVSYF